MSASIDQWSSLTNRALQGFSLCPASLRPGDGTLVLGGGGNECLATDVGPISVVDASVGNDGYQFSMRIVRQPGIYIPYLCRWAIVT